MAPVLKHVNSCAVKLWLKNELTSVPITFLKSNKFPILITIVIDYDYKITQQLK